MTRIIKIFCHNFFKKVIVLPGIHHRAAIGLSEQCDALIVVVSEETGTISVAEGGRLMRRFDEQTLAAKIRPAFVGKDDKIFGKFFSKWRADK